MDDLPFVTDATEAHRFAEPDVRRLPVDLGAGEVVERMHVSEAGGGGNGKVADFVADVAAEGGEPALEVLPQRQVGLEGRREVKADRVALEVADDARHVFAAQSLGPILNDRAHGLLAAGGG